MRNLDLNKKEDFLEALSGCLKKTDSLKDSNLRGVREKLEEILKYQDALHALYLAKSPELKKFTETLGVDNPTNNTMINCFINSCSKDELSDKKLFQKQDPLNASFSFIQPSFVNPSFSNLSIFMGPKNETPERRNRFVAVPKTGM